MSGNCNKDACRYAHVTVSPTTLVCRPFALLGYCDKGKTCDKQHVFECPDYADTGRCPNEGQCKLQHVRHAHQERKRLRSDDDSEVESSGDEEMRDEQEDEDASSDIVVRGVNGSSYEISQNQDYISLS